MWKLTRSCLLYFPFIVFLMQFGCGREEKSQTEGFFLSSSRWTNRTLNVCWENPSAQDAEKREWVKQAVESQYNQLTPIQFAGWGACSDKSNVRIQVEDTGPHTKGLGKQINNMPNGMVLNFTFETW